jgi:hypothetical protein
LRKKKAFIMLHDFGFILPIRRQKPDGKGYHSEIKEYQDRSVMPNLFRHPIAQENLPSTHFADFGVSSVERSGRCASINVRAIRNSVEKCEFFYNPAA